MKKRANAKCNKLCTSCHSLFFISYLKDHLCEKERKDEKTDEKNINNTQCKRLNRWIFSYFQ